MQGAEGRFVPCHLGLKQAVTAGLEVAAIGILFPQSFGRGGGPRGFPHGGGLSISHSDVFVFLLILFLRQLTFPLSVQSQPRWPLEGRAVSQGQAVGNTHVLSDLPCMEGEGDCTSLKPSEACLRLDVSELGA